MSTPIANIPIASGKTDEDPEVAELLNEMNTASPPPIQRDVYKKHNMPPTKVVYQRDVEERKQLFHTETAQKALYLAAIAFIIFYPALLNPIYEKFPNIEKFKDSELLIRSAILGVVVYAILWKFYL
jgi:hypothetical protein